MSVRDLIWERDQLRALCWWVAQELRAGVTATPIIERLETAAEGHLREGQTARAPEGKAEASPESLQGHLQSPLSPDPGQDLNAQEEDVRRRTSGGRRAVGSATPTPEPVREMVEVHKELGANRGPRPDKMLTTAQRRVLKAFGPTAMAYWELEMETGLKRTQIISCVYALSARDLVRRDGAKWRRVL